MKSQTKKSSYKKLFSSLFESNDFFEVGVLERIKEDYDKLHDHDIQKFYEFLVENETLTCPSCKTTLISKNGRDKNGTQRYLCRKCRKSFTSTNNSLFYSSKVNIQAWFVFLECLLSGSSTSTACIAAKISTVTGKEWLRKIFNTLKNYQETIKLGDIVYIDETYVHEDKSKIFYYNEIGKIRKVKKQPRGISRNKICILVATDGKSSFAEIVCHGRPQRMLNLEICKKHIKNGSRLIGDEDTSLTLTVNEMNLVRETYKGNTEKAYEKLEPVDQLCARLKFFLDKHRGFKKDKLQDYLNLFIFIDNSKNTTFDLYKVTLTLLKMMFAYKTP